MAAKRTTRRTTAPRAVARKTAPAPTPADETPDPFSAPIAALNELVLENAGRWFSLQLAIASRLSGTVLEECHRIADIRDLEDFQEYLARQPESLQQLADANARDMEAAARIGMACLGSASGIVSGAVSRPY